MNDDLKVELVVATASKIHADWCKGEYEAYYKRAKASYDASESKNPGEALEQACYKGDTKRNEVELDTSFLVGHETMASAMFSSFENFMALVNAGAVDVKRFASRNLTPEEIEKAGPNYKDGKENILRDFRVLSEESKRENIQAAIGAVKVYEELCKAGIDMNTMLTDENLRHDIGVAIHTDWMKRNEGRADESLMVSFDKLDEWTKSQDLVIFDALVGIASRDEKYRVPQEAGYTLPDYANEEKAYLGASL